MSATLMTRREACAELSISLRTLDRIVMEGKLQTVKVSARGVRIRRTAVEKYITRMERFADERLDAISGAG